MSARGPQMGKWSWDTWWGVQAAKWFDCFLIWSNFDLYTRSLSCSAATRDWKTCVGGFFCLAMLVGLPFVILTDTWAMAAKVQVTGAMNTFKCCPFIGASSFL